MNLTLVVWICVLALFLALLGLQVLGCRLGARRLENDPAAARVGAIEGAIFALLGLLIAFTFSGASSRFEARRQLIVEETNAIGTAWLRLDLLPEEAQEALRPLFRDYVDARIAGHGLLPDVDAALASLTRATDLQGEIWTSALDGCAQSATPQVMPVVLTALNQMFDVAGARVAALRMHPSIMIFALLVLLCMCCAFLAGFGIAKTQPPSWIYLIAFAAVLTFTIYVIVDLEFPRAGLIRVDATDQLLVDLRQSLEEPRTR